MRGGLRAPRALPPKVRVCNSWVGQHGDFWSFLGTDFGYLRDSTPRMRALSSSDRPPQNAVGLSDAKCVIRACGSDGALLTDGLCLGDAGFTGLVSFIERVVENGAVQAAARCGDLPFPIRDKGFGKSLGVGHEIPLIR